MGDPDQVTERIEEYRKLGIDAFVLSGYPHLEEAWRFGELVLPNLPTAYPVPCRTASINTSPFGETIANTMRPKPKASAS